MLDKKTLSTREIERNLNMLNRNFRNVRGKFFNDANLNIAEKKEAVKRAEVEFSYLFDEIERGPVCLASKRISEANDFISSFAAQVRKGTDVSDVG